MGLQQFLLFLSLAGAGTSLVCNTCAELEVTVGDVAMNSSDIADYEVVACTSEAQVNKTCNATAGEDSCISGYMTLSYTTDMNGTEFTIAMEISALNECGPSSFTCDSGAKEDHVALLSTFAGGDADIPAGDITLDSCVIKKCTTDICNTDNATAIADYANDIDNEDDEEIDDEETDDEDTDEEETEDQPNGNSGSFSHYTVSSRPVSSRPYS